MTEEERLARVQFEGIQFVQDPDNRITGGLALCTDPRTHTTFALRDGETLAQALARIDEIWAAAAARSSDENV